MRFLFLFLFLSISTYSLGQDKREKLYVDCVCDVEMSSKKRGFDVELKQGTSLKGIITKKEYEFYKLGTDVRFSNGYVYFGTDGYYWSSFVKSNDSSYPSALELLDSIFVCNKAATLADIPDPSPHTTVTSDDGTVTVINIDNNYDLSVTHPENLDNDPTNEKDTFYIGGFEYTNGDDLKNGIAQCISDSLAGIDFETTFEITSYVSNDTTYFVHDVNGVLDTTFDTNSQSLTSIINDTLLDGTIKQSYINEQNELFEILADNTPPIVDTDNTPWRKQLDGVTKTDITNEPFGIVTNQRVTIAPNDVGAGAFTSGQIKGMYIKTTGTSLTNELQRWNSGFGTVMKILENGDLVVGNGGLSDSAPGFWTNRFGRTSIAKNGLMLFLNDLNATPGDMIRLRSNNTDVGNIGIDVGNKVYIKAVSKKLTVTPQGVIEIPIASTFPPPAPSSGAGLTSFGGVYYKWDGSNWVAF